MKYYVVKTKEGGGFLNSDGKRPPSCIVSEKS